MSTSKVFNREELIALVENVALTITSTQRILSSAKVNLVSRGWITIPTFNSALRDSGDWCNDMYTKGLTRNKGADKITIRRLVAEIVAEHLEDNDIVLANVVSAHEVDHLVDTYKPRCDLSGLEQRVYNNLTTEAFNNMSDDDKINWLGQTVVGNIVAKGCTASMKGFEFDSTPIKEGDAVTITSHTQITDPVAPEGSLKILDHANIMDSVSMTLEQHAMRTDIIDAYTKSVITRNNYKKAFHMLAYGTGKETITRETGVQFKTTEEKTTMNYTKKAAKLQEVFGVVITGKDKGLLMEMIREAQKEIETFDDLAGKSTFVDAQVATINAGIVAL